MISSSMMTRPLVGKSPKSLAHSMDDVVALMSAANVVANVFAEPKNNF